MFPGFVQIGFVGKAHGLEGELKLSLDEQYVEDFSKTKAVFIKVKGQPMPYFIENIRGKLFAIVKFEDVNDRTAAQLIANKELLLRESDIIPDEEREFEVDESDFFYLKGYTIHEKEKGLIGKIEAILEMPQQEMAQLNYQNRQILIPLNEAFILEIKKKNKTILMDLPEGLLEL